MSTLRCMLAYNFFIRISFLTGPNRHTFGQSGFHCFRHFHLSKQKAMTPADKPNKLLGWCIITPNIRHLFWPLTPRDANDTEVSISLPQSLGERVRTSLQLGHPWAQTRATPPHHPPAHPARPTPGATHTTSYPASPHMVASWWWLHSRGFEHAQMLRGIPYSAAAS